MIAKRFIPTIKNTILLVAIIKVEVRNPAMSNTRLEYQNNPLSFGKAEPIKKELQVSETLVTMLQNRAQL